MKNGKKLGITTVLYNSSSHLPLFVESLLRNKNVIDEVVFVDNHSEDNFSLLLSRLNDHVQYSVITNTRNNGYAKGINQGIVFLRKKGCEYILVTNNDLSMKERALETLLEDMNTSHAEVVGIPTTSNGVDFILGNAYDHKSNSVVPSSSVKEKELQLMIIHSKTIDTLYVQGGVILFNVSFFNKIGPYDDYLFFGGDESDFTLRLLRSSVPIHAVISLRAYNLFDHFTHHDGRFKLLKARMIMQGETYVLMKHGYTIWTREFWKKVFNLYKELGKRSPLRYFYLSLLLLRSLVVNVFYLKRK